MPAFTEQPHAAEAVLSEAAAGYSRDTITILAGSGVVKACTVLGRIRTGAASSAAKSGGNTGNGTLTLDASTPVLAGAKAGVYAVRCIVAAANGGTFRVEDPDGQVIGDVPVGATFADDVKFVIADGTSDFIVGDGFDVTVAAGSGKHKPSPVSAVDGSDAAVAMNLYEVDATSVDVKVAAITRQAQLNANLLSYDASVDDGTKKAAKAAQLALAGIIVR